VREALHRTPIDPLRACRGDQGRPRLRDFADAEPGFTAWVHARAWTTGDGPKAIFTDAVAWLLDRRVLLPGVTTLARLVAQVRDDATQRLWDALYELLTTSQRAMLERLLEVPDGARFSDLEHWRKGPAQPSGRNLEKALSRVAEIAAVGLGELDLEAVVPRRRLVDLARYGLAAKAPQLRRHPPSRRSLRCWPPSCIWRPGPSTTAWSCSTC